MTSSCSSSNNNSNRRGGVGARERKKEWKKWKKKRRRRENKKKKTPTLLLTVLFVKPYLPFQCCLSSKMANKKTGNWSDNDGEKLEKRWHRGNPAQRISKQGPDRWMLILHSCWYTASIQYPPTNVTESKKATNMRTKLGLTGYSRW